MVWWRRGPRSGSGSAGEAARGQGRRPGQLHRANRLVRQPQLLTSLHYRGRRVGPAGSCSRHLDDDAGADVCYVHPPGAEPERSWAPREMAVDRPGDREGSRSVGVPAAGAGELRQRVFVSEIPVGPGVDQRGGRQEIALAVRRPESMTSSSRSAKPAAVASPGSSPCDLATASSWHHAGQARATAALRRSAGTARAARRTSRPFP